MEPWVHLGVSIRTGIQVQTPTAVLKPPDLFNLKYGLRGESVTRLSHHRWSGDLNLDTHYTIWLDNLFPSLQPLLQMKINNLNLKYLPKKTARHFKPLSNVSPIIYYIEADFSSLLVITLPLSPSLKLIALYETPIST